MENLPKIIISEKLITLPESEEMQREKLGLELARFLVRQNPKLSQIKKLSNQFARNKRLSLAQSNSILRYSLPEIINLKTMRIQIVPKSQNFDSVSNFFESYFYRFSTKSCGDFYKEFYHKLKKADLTILEIRFLMIKTQKIIQSCSHVLEHQEIEIGILEIKSFFEVLIASILFDRN